MAEIGYTGEVQPAINVLADRYPGQEIKRIFSPEAKIVYERMLWIEVMRAQSDLGFPIPPEAIQDYESVIYNIDFDSIREREKETKQDVAARIEEFNALAGHTYTHEAMTSRDLTDNTEQFQIRMGLEVIHDRAVATLARFGTRAAEYATLPMAGRSHNVAGQPITLGKRFSNFGEELLWHYGDLVNLIERYPLRGIKGPMGTQQDQADLLGSPENAQELERRIAEALGFAAILNSVGQVYPRSLDLSVINTLHELASGPSSFATTLRLMAGQELATEGFSEKQKGSSAMPHKRNTRTAERITGMKKILAGHATMAGSISGDQWNEGDVSCSVVRRVTIPDAFYTTDGLFQATLHVLDDFGAYPAVVNRELNRYLPFLATTKILNGAVKAGVNRDVAYAAIRRHSGAVAEAMSQEGLETNDLFDRIDKDEAMPLSKQQLEDFVGDPLDLTGRAAPQIASFVTEVQKIVDRHPEAAAYVPEPMV